jgi:hypothetical protein
VKRVLSFLFGLTLLISAPLAAASVEGILVDKACSGETKTYDDAKAHSRDCALMDDCKASGFGVVTKDGKFLKFDPAGDKMALDALGKSSKENNITVTVDGMVEGDSIKVTSLKLT